MKYPASPNNREHLPSNEVVAHFMGLLFNQYGLMFREGVQILFGLLLIIFLCSDFKRKKKQVNKLTGILTFVDKSRAHLFGLRDSFP
jgi:hypothetical protein